MLIGIKLRSLAITATLALAACGGGGGTASPSTTVALDPPSVAVSYPGENQALNTPDAKVTATFTNLPAGTLYPVVTADKPVLARAEATKTSSSTYSADLQFNSSLAAGTYSGTLTLKLCTDPQCGGTVALAGGTLPYTLTVTAPIKLTASVNGAPVTIVRGQSINIKDGDHVAVQSSVPVFFTTTQSGVRGDNQASTATTWSGTLSYGLSTPGGVGYYTVEAFTPQSKPGENQARTSVEFALTQ